MRKKYVVELTKEERERLLRLIRAGEAPARMLNRARVLLKADRRGEHASEGAALADREIARMLETSSATVGRVRERYFRQGLDAALERSMPERVYERSFDGRAEARLIALACSEAPEGRNRWSMRLLADKAEEAYPDAERIRLVCDNLSTHSPAAFYATFAPELAHRLARKVEFRYTPVHGSWLNMVEVKLSVLVRQCLGRRRLPDVGTLRREVEAWQEERNRRGSSVDWRFTTADARTKLRRLYPSIEP